MARMKQAATSKLTSRFVNVPDAVLISSFLHPRTKHLKFVSEEQRVAIHEKVKLELLENIENQAPAAPLSDALDIAKDNGEVMESGDDDTNDDFMDWIDDIVQPLEPEESADSKREQINRELLHYISEPSTKRNSLKWWKRMEPVFPNLALLARKYLCVPASSVPCERIFSLAGHLVSRRRAALSPDNVNMLIFLNKNINKI